RRRAASQNFLEPGCLAAGVLVQALPGDPDRRVARLERVGVAGAVGLERPAVVVEVPAVELDDHALLFEQRIDLVAADRRVDLRAREVVLGAEVQEGVLEPGTGGSGGCLDERVEELRAWVSGVAL